MQASCRNCHRRSASSFQFTSKMQIQVIVLYILLSLVVAYIGREHTLKFWGHFLVSLILSPIIGVIAIAVETFISDCKCKKECGEAEAAPPAAKTAKA